MNELEIECLIDDSEILIEVLIEDLVVNTGSGGDVTITDLVSGTIIDTVAAPGNYNVLQFSGINGGAANTIFTNSIIPA
jgi:hypothetical protein